VAGFHIRYKNKGKQQSLKNWVGEAKPTVKDRNIFF
jgi:hypothetical protein